MSAIYFRKISVESIENALNQMLSSFFDLDLGSPDFSGFFVTKFSFMGRKAERYPVTFKVNLKSSGDFKEFSLPVSQIVACLEEFFSTVDGAENMRFRPASIKYEYPQNEGDGEISMYCLLETASEVADNKNSVSTTDTAIMGW